MLSSLLSVAFEELVDEGEFIVPLDGVEWRERVALVLKYRHLSAIQVLTVGDTGHAGVAFLLGLEPGSEDLEELGDQILFLETQNQETLTIPYIYNL